MPGGVVGDEVKGDAALVQLPGGEARALQSGAGFINQHVNLFTLLVGGENDAQRRAPIHGGQSAGIAVV